MNASERSALGQLNNWIVYRDGENEALLLHAHDRDTLQFEKESIYYFINIKLHY